MGIISTQFDPEQFPANVIDGSDIVLLDGRKIRLYPVNNPSGETVSGEFQLDTTGEYLSLSPKFKLEESLEKRIERQYYNHLLFENAWFLLDNAEKIFSDSRMFLAPVKIQNGLAYFGTSGFQHPTLGVYLEWWLNFSEASIDGNGNPVWYISGSPLSGRNCCRAATVEGESVEIKQMTSFSDIWSSFCKVNNRYNEAKLDFQAFSIEEVLIKLRGESYIFKIQEIKYKLLDEIRKGEIKNLNRVIKSISDKLDLNIRRNKERELRQNLAQIKEFKRTYDELQAELKPIHEKYLKDYKQLKAELHKGSLEGNYHQSLAEISREMRDKKHEISVLSNKFMHSVFDKNPNSINLNDVLRFAKRHP